MKNVVATEGQKCEKEPKHIKKQPISTENDLFLIFCEKAIQTKKMGQKRKFKSKKGLKKRKKRRKNQTVTFLHITDIIIRYNSDNICCQFLSILLCF